MNSTTIGIKIADGSFYPIVNRDEIRRKKLILTTVRDGQTNVQIDLYEGENVAIESAKYLGSLLIEDITPAPGGEPEIELKIGVEEDGQLSAMAKDLSSGESQSLNVSLESLSEDSIYDIPEFELGDELDTWAESENEMQDELLRDTTDAYQEEDEYADSQLGFSSPPARKPLMLALFIVFGIAAVAALAIFLFKLFEGPDVPPLEAQEQTQVEMVVDNPEEMNGAAEVETATASQTGDSGAVSARDGPKVTEESGVSPSTPDESTDGVWYWIRRGDTLWDISWNFYRTPWLYGRIAEDNSIKNPDLIFAGAKIFVSSGD